MTKFKVLVKTREDDKWVGNGLFFDTRDAAKKYAADLTRRWLAVTNTKIVKVPNALWPTTAELIKRVTDNKAGRS